MMIPCPSHPFRRCQTLRSVLCILAGLLWITAAQAVDVHLQDVPAQVYFSPRGGATAEIIRIIGQARREIQIQAYSFTSEPIAKALLTAHKRGIRVEAILDKSQQGERYRAATFLHHSGIPTYIDTSHAIAHNKIILVDRQILITGSFNFTKAAEEKNAENLLVLHSSELAQIYYANWQSHRDHSVPYVADATPPSRPVRNPS